MKNIRYIPKIGTTLVYLVMLIVVFILFFGRKSATLQMDVLTDRFPDFYQHISNFSISCLLFSGIGYFWLMMGIPFKYINMLGIVILTINFVYERWIPVLNTPDLIDAFYGFWGTMLAFLFLLLTKKYGLTINKTENDFKSNR